MSWVQLHDEVWPVTNDGAELRVHILAPDVGCPRVSWNLSATHAIDPEPPPGPNEPKIERWLDIDLGNLILNVRDWRRLANLEIRADTAWHATQEFVGPYGHSDNSPRVTVYQSVLEHYAKRTGREAGWTSWIAHDFILRLGSRDGWSFPCELDAWLIPDKEYYRRKPEKPEEVARFAEGPPDLRLVTRATFGGGTVELSRNAAADPLAHARETLAGQIGCESMENAKLEWMLRQKLHSDDFERMPGWRSDVRFFTTPREL